MAYRRSSRGYSSRRKSYSSRSRSTGRRPARRAARGRSRAGGEFKLVLELANPSAVSRGPLSIAAPAAKRAKF